MTNINLKSGFNNFLSQSQQPWNDLEMPVSDKLQGWLAMILAGN